MIKKKNKTIKKLKKKEHNLLEYYSLDFFL